MDTLPRCRYIQTSPCRTTERSNPKACWIGLDSGARFFPLPRSVSSSQEKGRCFFSISKSPMPGKLGHRFRSRSIQSVEFGNDSGFFRKPKLESEIPHTQGISAHRHWRVEGVVRFSYPLSMSSCDNGRGSRSNASGARQIRGSSGPGAGGSRRRPLMSLSAPSLFVPGFRSVFVCHPRIPEAAG